MRPLASALYTGTLAHRRRTPREHAFRFPLFMVYLDLAELDRVFDGRWLWSTRHPAPARFCRGDYLGPADVPLDVAVRDEVERCTGRRPEGPIRLLTHLRYWGYAFNPLSLYFCFSADTGGVDAVVAEVTNTPWKERHAYVLDARRQAADGPLRFRHRKAMHVSPFMDMDMDYVWQMDVPGDTLEVRIANRKGDETLFEAGLSLRRREITGRSLASVLLRYPLMTTRVIAGIHLQALRLWWKGVPFRAHPERGAGARAERA